MKLVLAPRNVRRSSPGWSILLLLVLLGNGCGKKGPPLPPEPRGPLPPGSVRARQIGDRVVVSFLVPRARGDKLSQQPVRAELIRVAYAPGLEPPPDPDAFRRRGELVGHAAGDPLPAGETWDLVDGRWSASSLVGIGSTLRYAVRVRDRRSRPSPLVVAKDLVPVLPVPPPRDLSAEPTADGIRLVWKAPVGGENLEYNLYRSPAGTPPAATPLNPEPLNVEEYLDEGVVPGRSYSYMVRVSLADGLPFREGEGGPAIRVLAEDRFAPESPEGLVVVQEGLALRLFWNPNRERDLAGYRVYRRSGAEPWRPVGPDPVEQPLYLDPAVRVGQTVSYRVTAIDRASPPNESRPSAAVDTEVLQEPVAPGRPGS